MHSSAPSKGRPRAAFAVERTTSGEPQLGCASLRRDDPAGHRRKLDDLDGWKKPLRERRKDDLDDLDELLRRILQTHIMALSRAACWALPVTSPHPAANREMVVLVVQVVRPHVKNAELYPAGPFPEQWGELVSV